jgi:hypothetical protein
MLLALRPEMQSVRRDAGKNGTMNAFTVSPPLIFRKIPPTEPTVNSRKPRGKSSMTKD